MGCKTPLFSTVGGPWPLIYIASSLVSEGWRFSPGPLVSSTIPEMSKIPVFITLGAPHILTILGLLHVHVYATTNLFLCFRKLLVFAISFSYLLYSLWSLRQCLHGIGQEFIYCADILGNGFP